eukprot:1546121-Pleurochrysis_carterae.AAC.1
MAQPRRGGAKRNVARGTRGAACRMRPHAHTGTYTRRHTDQHTLGDASTRMHPQTFAPRGRRFAGMRACKRVA